LTIGVSRNPKAADAAEASAASINLHVSVTPLLWRIQSWRVATLLERQAARLGSPRRAMIAVSPYWVSAAKRAWPKLPLVYLFPCLLANCLPFTWRGRRSPSWWRRADYAGIVRAEHRAFELADLTLVPTVQALDEVLAFHSGVEDRLIVCPYGCELRATIPAMRPMQRDALELSGDEFVILVAGVGDLNKAFDHAIRELPAMGPSARLVILGDGPERSRWTHLAAEMGIADRVRVAGPQADAAPWHTAADCVVSTSWYDTFPNVVLEGMTHGRPVIVPRHDPPHVYSGTAELVHETGAGLVYDRRQPGALASVVNRLMADRDSAEAMGCRGRTAARERFHWDRAVNHVAELCGETAMAGSHGVQTARPEGRGSGAVECESVHVG
jgi:glycosyltransferase involved in cell wall biosynthesis